MKQVLLASNFEQAVLCRDANLNLPHKLKGWEMSPDMVAHEEIRRERRTPTFIPKRPPRRDESPARCGDSWPPMLADTLCLA